MKTPEEVIKWCDMMLERKPNVEDRNYFNAIKRYMNEERPQGEWIVLLDDDNIQTCKCSICGRMVDIAGYEFDKFPFCHCGASMRGVRE